MGESAEDFARRGRWLQDWNGVERAELDRGPLDVAFTLEALGGTADGFARVLGLVHAIRPDYVPAGLCDVARGYRVGVAPDAGRSSGEALGCYLGAVIVAWTIPPGLLQADPILPLGIGRAIERNDGRERLCQGLEMRDLPPRLKPEESMSGDALKALARKLLSEMAPSDLDVAARLRGGAPKRMQRGRQPLLPAEAAGRFAARLSIPSVVRNAAYECLAARQALLAGANVHGTGTAELS